MGNCSCIHNFPRGEISKMNNEQKLERYEKVNACESLQSLASVIKDFADNEGMIQGRSRKFNAHQMASYCLELAHVQPRLLTREYGIRQQAMYIINS